jgi:hypothetical protein
MQSLRREIGNYQVASFSVEIVREVADETLG